ncbi:MAG: hypothetical protein B6D45_06530 [Ignavibacteriales bacterium UTCHB3]|nr:MAG: hypothetical protein B6D45_06530 [Ignavibacteriales bacterium UTCHB3]
MAVLKASGRMLTGAITNFTPDTATFWLCQIRTAQPATDRITQPPFPVTGQEKLCRISTMADYIESLPYVDTARIGAMGWSFGGYMVNWLQAKTTRFKCFASMMGIYNLTSFYGSTEELWFPEWDLKGTPWTSDLYRTQSPSEYVKDFRTPTLIVTGTIDFRVSYTQSLEYFTALQKMGIDSRLVILEDASHWPQHLTRMPLYYNAHLEWFHKYLGGDPAPYDTKKMWRNNF